MFFLISDFFFISSHIQPIKEWTVCEKWSKVGRIIAASTVRN